jgi:hypothetical protein
MEAININGNLRIAVSRREIIDYWKKQSDEHLNSLCCPNCRDILNKIDDSNYECTNSLCALCESSKGE